MVSNGSLYLRADTLDNIKSGLIAANVGIAIDARQVDNRAGEISSTSKVAVNAREQLDNRAGAIKCSTMDLKVDRASLVNRGGEVVGDSCLGATGGAFDNRDGGSASGKAGVRVEVASLRNDQGGKLLSDGRLDLAANAVG
ncbi:hypothetical protein, partial [Pseudomonas aeruginosa]|uniref:hypothetical protein n=1 Tax=Pseudomonas aeruginosa TaxID=287 RepID=UPI0032678B14